MNILAVSHQFSTTGASVMMLRLMQTLAEQGHHVRHIAMDPTPGPMLKACEAAGFPLATSGIAVENLDVCVANTVVGAQFVLRHGRAVPTVWWMHETDVALHVLLKHPELIGAFEIAAAIVVQTPFQRDDVFRSFTYRLPADRLHVVPYPIVPPETPVTPVPRSPGRLRIVAVGIVEPRKRHGDLCAALDRLGRDDLEVVVCGRLHHVPDDMQAAIGAAAGRIRLVGEIPRATCLGWLASADIVCLPSASESQPLAAMEGAWLRKPLVLSDLHCYRGTSEHERNALLHPVGDVPALAAALGRLAEDPDLRATLGSEAGRTVADADLATFARRFDDLLSRVRASSRTWTGARPAARA